MTKEQAIEYLKIAAKVTEDAYNLRQMKDEEGRGLFCTGQDMYEIHMYDCDAFAEMGRSFKPAQFRRTGHITQLRFTFHWRFILHQ